jgi:hypothetical protein
MLLSAAGATVDVGELVPMAGASDQAYVASEVSPATGRDGEGNVVSAFGREACGVRVIWGETTVVEGGRVATWALVSPRDNTILAIGATFSLKMAQEMPAHGSGPAGAFASLEFPALVQQTTFFNHLEVQPEPEGHVSPPGAVNPNIFGVPHFDFHFYDITEDAVRAIQAGPPLAPVPANLLPAGYLPAGPSIAEMGRHSSPASVLTDPNPLSAVMVAGYVPNGTRMHFIEPMVSQVKLLEQQGFSLPVPVPQDLGRGSATLYPTRFEAVYQGNAYHFVFSDFITLGGTATAPATSSASSSADGPASSGYGARLQAAASVKLAAAFDALGPAAFRSLDVVGKRFSPTPRPARAPNPVQVAPDVALDYGDAVDVSPGLDVALSQFDPTDPLPIDAIVHDDGDLPALDAALSDPDLWIG